jgi:hypothetical protein
LSPGTDHPSTDYVLATFCRTITSQNAALRAFKKMA